MNEWMNLLIWTTCLHPMTAGIVQEEAVLKMSGWMSMQTMLHYCLESKSKTCQVHFFFWSGTFISVRNLTLKQDNPVQSFEKKRRYFCGHPLYCAPFDFQVAPATQYWVIIVHHHHKRETVCSQFAPEEIQQKAVKLILERKKCRNEWERNGWKLKVFYPI